jgi:hypothetical protein
MQELEAKSRNVFGLKMHVRCGKDPGFTASDADVSVWCFALGGACWRVCVGRGGVGAPDAVRQRLVELTSAVRETASREGFDGR